MPDSTSFSMGNSEYINRKLPFQNGLSYVSGYLLHKCLGKHSCDVCVCYAKECETVSNNNYFAHFKAYCTDRNAFCNLKMPGAEFWDFVCFMEQTVLEKFSLYVSRKPAFQLVRKIRKYNYTHPCKNFPNTYLVHLLVRFRIFSITRDDNREFKAKAIRPQDGTQQFILKRKKPVQKNINVRYL